MPPSKFPKQDVRFKDTRGAGGISVRGIYLEPDEDGFIEGPANLAAEINPHGFFQEGSAEYNEWLKSQPAKAAPQAAAQEARRR